MNSISEHEFTDYKDSLLEGIKESANSFQLEKSETTNVKGYKGFYFKYHSELDGCDGIYEIEATYFVYNYRSYIFSIAKYPDCQIDYSVDYAALIDSIEFNNADGSDVEEIASGTEPFDTDEDIYSDGLNAYASGEYHFITNEDLDVYGKNMEGVKIYIVGSVDDMKDNKIQVTLDDGFMMSSFDVADNYDRYSYTISEGDTVAILGTVSGYYDYGFLGNSVDVGDCLVIAAGDDALLYKKDTTDAELEEYIKEPVEPQVFQVQNSVIYEGHGTTVKITDVKDGGNSFDLKVNIVNDSDLNLGFNARAYAVNGIMTGNNIYDMDCDVAAHREANTTLKLKKDFLEEYGIKTIKRIDLLLWAYDNDKSFKEFDSGQLTILTTNDDGNYPEQVTGEAVYENGGLQIDYLKNDGNAFTFMVTNNTGSYMSFDVENICFNGYTSSEIDYDLIGTIVLNSCQTIIRLEPSNDFMNDNNINEVDTVDFTLNVRPEEDYFDEWNTEMISVVDAGLPAPSAQKH